VADYLKFAFDQGQFFWDTADAYKTHPHIKQALKSIPREKVTILTKTDVRTAAEMKADLDRYRQELGTDYIDIVLLHGMRSPKWPEEFQGVMDVLSEAREKGVIRTHGASIHSLAALQLAATTPWCQVQMQGINHAGVRMDSKDPETVVAALRQSKAAGVGVLGMKVLGEGALKDQMDETLRFVMGIGCVDAFTIGAANRGELTHLISRIEAV
jgi:predicted aldo/keto reductase-like oxidoreductase